jgi:arabinose-5-phosphate isomerase
MRPTEPQAETEAPPAARSRRELASEVLGLAADALRGLTERLDDSFDAAVDELLATTGMVVVTGMGKAGLVGAKLSATLASTGTPSLSLHPAEAVHGDLGRIRPQDLVLALSNSGETGELKALIPAIRRIGARIVAIVGSADSTLARHADVVLDIGSPPEACPLGLAPTTTTTAMLALGDALAMVVQRERGFSREDFARYHPAGSLGRRLMRVGDVMRKGAELPLIPAGTSLRQALVAMSNTKGRPGAGLVVEPGGRLVGIFTDGDLRRLLEAGGLMSLEGPIDDSMGHDPKSLTADELVADAMHLLQTHRIDQLAVVDGHGRPIGLLDIQDLLDVRI